MSKEEKRENPNAEEVLAGQIGTDNKDLAMGRIDVRRLTYLNAIEKICIAYFLMVPKKRGGRFAQGYFSNYLNLAMSEEGRRVNQVIKMVAGSKGTTSGVEFVKSPGWVGRNLTKRDWRKQAEEEGQVVVE